MTFSVGTTPPGRLMMILITYDWTSLTILKDWSKIKNLMSNGAKFTFTVLHNKTSIDTDNYL